MNRALLMIALLFLSITAYAEIEKLAMPCDTGICFHWWPKLPIVKGWHHDKDYSIHYSFNAQAPDGKNFGNAETVIYANALFKPRIPDTKNLQMLIDDDQKKFKSELPDVIIKEVLPIVTGGGKSLRSFTYTPTKAGSWEQVAYGEEGEFYIIFTISSRSKSGLANELVNYRKFINEYK